MELDFQLTPRSRMLLGVLGGVILVWLSIEGAPTLYRAFRNQDTAVRQEQLYQTVSLVNAAEVLREIESSIYEATGLAADEARDVPGDQVATLFDTAFPETVIRGRIDALVKRAGIQQNYQISTKPGGGKQALKVTLQNRKRLILYLYLKHIEAEAQRLAESAEITAEEETFDMLMDAWLSGTEVDAAENGDETDEGSVERADPEPASTDKKKPADLADSDGRWKFATLPESIPVKVRARLATYIREQLLQQLWGVAPLGLQFFESEITKIEIPARPGIFGLGGQPATVEIRLRRDSVLFEILTEALDTHTEKTADANTLQADLVEYVVAIEDQSAMLVEQLALAPSTYETQLYTVDMKFKTNLEKLVNLNRFIETEMRWLSVRDLKISTDKRSSGSESARDRGRDNLSVSIVFVARVF